MKRYLLALFLLALIAFWPTNALAYQLDGPSIVAVSDANAVFETRIVSADLNNGFSAQFFGPTNFTIEIHENILKITVFNAVSFYRTEYVATLISTVKGEKKEKKITLQFQEPVFQSVTKPQ